MYQVTTRFHCWFDGLLRKKKGYDIHKNMGALEIIYQSSVSGRRFKRFQCVTNVHYRLLTDNLEQLNFNFSQRVSNCTDKMSGNPRICPMNTQF